MDTAFIIHYNLIKRIGDIFKNRDFVLWGTIEVYLILGLECSYSLCSPWTRNIRRYRCVHAHINNLNAYKQTYREMPNKDKKQIFFVIRGMKTWTRLRTSGSISVSTTTPTHTRPHKYMIQVVRPVSELPLWLNDGFTLLRHNFWSRDSAVK
jgi:hypothetical protein